MSKITLNNLTVNYQVKRKQFLTAVNNASEVFSSNQINVIVGESGCGKTTILRAIAGIIDYEGDIYFDETCVNKFLPRERNISYVSQMIGLYPNKTVFNNIAFPLKVARCDDEEIRERVKEVTDLLHISFLITRKPKELSIGQAQRVAIARALVKRSGVYLFDEPFSNLDKPLSHQLSIELKKILKDLGATVIFISHDIEESFLLADKIFVMHEGKFIASGTPENIIKSKDERVRAILGIQNEQTL